MSKIAFFRTFFKLSLTLDFFTSTITKKTTNKKQKTSII